MSIEQIRELKRAIPFRPFVLVTKGGKRIAISSPALIAISPTGKSIMASGTPLLSIADIGAIRTLRRRKRHWGVGRKLPSSTDSRTLPAVNVEEIRELHSAAPFEPFELILTNGARLLVDHPEFMSFSRDHRTVYVSKLNAGTQRVDVKLVVALNEMANGARTRKRKR